MHEILPEPFDLRCKGLAEVRVERVARLELRAVHQPGARASIRIAVFVEVVEEVEPSVERADRAVVLRAREPSDVLVHELRRSSVVAHHNEARRYIHAGCGCPRVKRLLVVPVQRLEGRLQFDRYEMRVEDAALAGALLWHLGRDVRPQLPEDRHFGLRDIVGYWHPWELHDAALDGVHKREVAHGPREQGAFGVAGAAQKERRGGKVEHAREPELSVHGLEARNPETRGLLVCLRLLPFIALEHGLSVGVRFLAVAVMRFVVEGEDVLHPHELGHHPLKHLPFGFERLQRGTVTL